MSGIDEIVSSPAYAFALIDLPPAFDCHTLSHHDLMASHESYRGHSVGADNCTLVCAFCTMCTWESPHRTVSIVRYMVACRVIAGSWLSGNLPRLVHIARQPENRQIEVFNSPAACE